MLAALAVLAALISGPQDEAALGPHDREVLEGPWSYIAIGDEMTVAWSEASIVRSDNGSQAEIIRLAYYRDTNRLLPTPFDWVVQQVQIDCLQGTYTIVDGGYFNRSGEWVAQVAPQAARPVTRQTTEDMMGAVACGGSQVQGSVRVADFAALIDTLNAAREAGLSAAQ